MSFRAPGDSRGVLRLRAIWSHLDGGGYPLERVDLLDRTKIFGDVHRVSSFDLGRRVVPTIDVTAPAEQQPAFYGSLTQGSGGAGTNAAVELANFSGNNVIARPLIVLVKSVAATDVNFFLRAHQFLGGAPAGPLQNGFLDTRRGLNAGAGSSTPGQSRCALLSSAVAANAPADPVFRFDVGAGVYTPVPHDVLIAAIAQPGTDIVVESALAANPLQVSWAWIEEQFANPTRAPNG